MDDALPQLAALQVPCDIRNDGVACPRRGAYRMITYCVSCQQAPEPRLACTGCLTTLTAHGVRCSACGEPLRLGDIARLAS